ncbi:hypothetical protein VPH35_037158 [Triticum aestivum]
MAVRGGASSPSASPSSSPPRRRHLSGVGRGLDMSTPSTRPCWVVRLRHPSLVRECRFGPGSAPSLSARVRRCRLASVGRVRPLTAPPTAARPLLFCTVFSSGRTRGRSSIHHLYISQRLPRQSPDNIMVSCTNTAALTSYGHGLVARTHAPAACVLVVCGTTHARIASCLASLGRLPTPAYTGSGRPAPTLSDCTLLQLLLRGPAAVPSA